MVQNKLYKIVPCSASVPVGVPYNLICIWHLFLEGIQKYKCRCEFYEQLTNMRQFTDQSKTLSTSMYFMSFIWLNLYNH